MFYIRSDFWASSLEPGPGTTRVTVAGHSFDEELARLGTTYLMLDIEGGEVDLLMNHALPAQLRAVCMEVHPEIVGGELTQNLLRKLMDEGFVLDTRVSGEAVVFWNARLRACERGIDVAHELLGRIFTQDLSSGVLVGATLDIGKGDRKCDALSQLVWPPVAHEPHVDPLADRSRLGRAGAGSVHENRTIGQSFELSVPHTLRDGRSTQTRRPSELDGDAH